MAQHGWGTEVEPVPAVTVPDLATVVAGGTLLVDGKPHAIREAWPAGSLRDPARWAVLADRGRVLVRTAR